MPLLFIAVFLASFITGSGAGYYVQQKYNIPGWGQPQTTITLPPGAPTPTTDPKACYPKLETDKVIQGSEIVIEARQFLKLDANGAAINECEDIGNPIRMCCADNTPGDYQYSCDIRGVKELEDEPEGGDAYAYRKDNYKQILENLFGNNPRGEEDKEIETGPWGDFDRDRTDHNWVLVKQGAWLPSWKVAFSSGSTKWKLFNYWWVEGAAIEEDCKHPNDQCTDVFFREMTRIGHLSLSSNSKLLSRYGSYSPDPQRAVGDIWVGTGWCPNGKDNPAGGGNNAQAVCNDPLVRNVLLVVYQKGRGPRSGKGSGDLTNRSSADESDPKNNWWAFDIYYDEKTLRDNASRRIGTAQITNDNLLKGDLPCWMRLGCETRNPGDENNPGPEGYTRIDPKWDKPCREINPTPILTPGAYLLPKQGSPLSFINTFQKKVKALYSSLVKQVFAQTQIFPQFVSGRAIVGITKANPLFYNTYIMNVNVVPLPAGMDLVGKLHAPVVTLMMGGGGEVEYQVYADPSNLQQIYLKSGGKIMQYNFVHREESQGENLKLDTFAPPTILPSLPSVPPTFRYEWYTPACKPAIYLYPEKETNISVSVIPQGKLTVSNPPYNQGWNNVLAKPNGELVYNHTTYPYLYYEAEIKNVISPKEGWVVKKEDLSGFFNTILPYLSLNTQESRDFKDYWLNKLTDKPYYFISLLDRNYLDQIETINFTTQPDTFIRVRFYFEGLDKLRLTIPPSLPTTPKRNGFTAVDWGGMIANSSCSTENLQIVQ